MRKRFAAALVALSFVASPAFAEWRRAESPNFVVYGEGSEKALRDYVRTLEAYDTFLRLNYGVPLHEPPPRKMSIYLVDGVNELRRVLPSAATGVAGFYSPVVEDVFAVAFRDRTWDLPMLHEYAHHFMLARFPSGYPAWLVEGWAEYHGTFRLKNDGAFEVGMFDQGRARNLVSNSWLPFSDLLSKRPSELPGDMRKGMFYAQAWALTHYMLADDDRRKQLDRYLELVRKGRPSLEAMQEATGRKASQLQNDVKDYLAGRIGYRTVKMDNRVEPTISVEVLPEPTEALLLESQSTKLSLNPEDSAKRLKRVRERPARFPGDRFAELTLARAEIRGGDTALGETLLRGLLARDDDDVEALQALAQALLHRAETETPVAAAATRTEARALLGRAHRARENDPVTLAYFAKAKSFDPDYPTDNTLDTLIVAFNMTPQSPGLRLQTAEALLKRRRFADALSVLEPLASNPHGGGPVEAARRLADLARAGAKAAGVALPSEAPAT